MITSTSPRNKNEAIGALRENISSGRRKRHEIERNHQKTAEEKERERKKKKVAKLRTYAEENKILLRS